jgi:peptidase S41-like protein
MKKSFGTVLLAVLAMGAAVSLCGLSAQSGASKELFEEITGRYQFEREGLPIVLTLAIEESRLMVDEPRFPPAEMVLLDSIRLQFRARHKNGPYDFRFTRDAKGRISDCIWGVGEKEYSGFRVDGVRLSSSFTRMQLHEDLLQLRRAMEGLHPALYDHTSPEEFDRLFEKGRKDLRSGMGPDEAYRIFAALTARIGCMHSSIWMPRGYWDRLEGRLFPVRLVFAGKKVLVNGSYSDRQTLPEGARIFAINGRPISKILADVSSVISADALSPNYRNHRLGSRFPLHYALFYGHPEAFEVTYSPPEGKNRLKAVLEPVATPRVWKNMVVRRELNFEIRKESNAALITIPHFSFYRNREKFFGFIDDAFDQIRSEGIQNLIIDLRGNSGGDPYCAAHLFSCIAQESVPYFAESFGGYAKLAEPIPLQDHRFKGRLYVLIDGGCGSTTGHLCGLLEYHGLGIKIGERTGATYVCHDAHRDFLLRHTRFQAGIATGTYATAVEGLAKDQGIEPDYAVWPAARDLAEGKDTVLEFALRKIRESGIR